MPSHITGSEAAPSSATRRNSGKVKLGTRSRYRIIKAKLDALVYQLCQLTHEYKRLTHEQTMLQLREEVLFANVQEQGEYLHNIAAVSITTQHQQRQPDDSTGSSSSSSSLDLADSSPTSAGVADAVADAALTDLSVLQALQQVGGGHTRRGHTPELRTTACLRAALTEQGIQWAKHVTLSEFVALYRERVLRLSFLLAHPDKADRLTGSVEGTVLDVVRSHMLLFAAADQLCLQLSLVNCDTGQQEPIPPGHFQQVCQSLDLQPGQAHQLRTGFQVYQARRGVLITKLQALAQQISAITSRDMNTLQPPSAAAAASTSQNPITGPNPWQRLGLADCGGLTLDDADHLQHLLLEYDRHVWQCRLLGRTLSWLLVNTLTIQQLAKGLVACYPFYPQPVVIRAAVQ